MRVKYEKVCCKTGREDNPAKIFIPKLLRFAPWGAQNANPEQLIELGIT